MLTPSTNRWSATAGMADDDVRVAIAAVGVVDERRRCGPTAPSPFDSLVHDREEGEAHPPVGFDLKAGSPRDGTSVMEASSSSAG